MKISVAIQCKDARSGMKGTFGYLKDHAVPLWSVTPVFPSMLQLIEYCNANNIERDYVLEPEVAK